VAVGTRIERILEMCLLNNIREGFQGRSLSLMTSLLSDQRLLFAFLMSRD
jgi:hypothetical protein